MKKRSIPNKQRRRMRKNMKSTVKRKKKINYDFYHHHKLGWHLKTTLLVNLRSFTGSILQLVL